VGKTTVNYGKQAGGSSLRTTPQGVGGWDVPPFAASSMCATAGNTYGGTGDSLSYGWETFLKKEITMRITGDKTECETWRQTEDKSI